MDKVLKNVKLLLGIKESETESDELLNLIIETVESQLKIILDEEDVPEELQFIIQEVSVVRFNRIGSEGMDSEAVEGHSVSYAKDDYLPYAQILSKYIQKEDGWKKGSVMFL